MLLFVWTLPFLEGNTRPESVLGHALRQFVSVSKTIGAIGISRFPAEDFVGPILFLKSARCRTRIRWRSKSTCPQVNARSSDERIPVKTARIMNGYQHEGRRRVTLVFTSIGNRAADF